MRKYNKARDIKVGVIGYGGAFNMGRKHLQEMQLAGMTPAAVCELDATNRPPRSIITNSAPDKPRILRSTPSVSGKLESANVLATSVSSCSIRDRVRRTEK